MVLPIVCAVIVVVLVVGYFVLDRKVKALQQAGVESVRSQLGEDAIVLLEEKALCKGTESGPFNTMLGHGTLGLSADRLVFLRWAPPGTLFGGGDPDTLEIARADIISRQVTVEHLGQQQTKPLLQITYRNPEHTEGETEGEDLVAFELDDPEPWVNALA